MWKPFEDGMTIIITTAIIAHYGYNANQNTGIKQVNKMLKVDVKKLLISMGATCALLSTVSTPVALPLVIEQVANAISAIGIKKPGINDKLQELTIKAAKNAFNTENNLIIEEDQLQKIMADCFSMRQINEYILSDEPIKLLSDALKTETLKVLEPDEYMRDFDFSNIAETILKAIDAGFDTDPALSSIKQLVLSQQIYDVVRETDAKVAEILKLIVGIESVHQNKAPHYLTNGPERKGMPLHRDKVIEALLQCIENNPKENLLISGFGGIGKTTIAKYLFHELKNSYKHVAWIEYDKTLQESLISSFTVPHSRNADDRIAWIMRFLNESGQDMLIIIDNYMGTGNSVKELAALSGTGAHIILTSRLAGIKGYKNFDIEFMEEDQCIDLFYHYYEYDENRTDEEAVRKLVSLVDKHTFSVELLALAANRPDYDLTKYYESLVNVGFRYPDLRVITDHDNREAVVAEHLVKLFDMVTLSEGQKYIVKNISIMPSIEISAAVIKWLDCDINDINHLLKLGWLHENRTNRTYFMHSIVKQSFALQDEVRYDDCSLLLNYMAGEEYIKPIEVFTEIHTKLRIAEAFLLKFVERQDKEFSILCNNIALVYSRQGDYPKALEWYQKAMAISEKVLGPEHPDTATTYNNIAGVYYSQGDYPKALEWYQKALIILEARLGKEHPNTLIVRKNIETLEL